MANCKILATPYTNVILLQNIIVPRGGHCIEQWFTIGNIDLSFLPAPTFPRHQAPYCDCMTHSGMGGRRSCTIIQDKWPHSLPPSLNDPHKLKEGTIYTITQVLCQQIGATICIAVLALPHLTPQPPSLSLLPPPSLKPTMPRIYRMKYANK